jgi:hypothetical protein
MDISGIAVEPVDEGNSESAVRFLIEWVSDGEAEARKYLADHAGACLGQRPLSKGMQVTMDDDLIIWLTKDLVS